MLGSIQTVIDIVGAVVAVLGGGSLASSARKVSDLKKKLDHIEYRVERGEKLLCDLRSHPKN